MLSNSEQLTWINEQYKPLFIKAFAFQKGEVIFLALLSRKKSLLSRGEARELSQNVYLIYYPSGASGLCRQD